MLTSWIDDAAGVVVDGVVVVGVVVVGVVVVRVVVLDLDRPIICIFPSLFTFLSNKLPRGCSSSPRC